MASILTSIDELNSVSSLRCSVSRVSLYSQNYCTMYLRCHSLMHTVGCTGTVVAQSKDDLAALVHYS